MARSIDRVRDYFRDKNMTLEVIELPGSTRTAQLAADAVGSQLGQIVKSLVFVDADSRTVLALVAGDRRADPDKIARAINSPAVRIAKAEEVRERTGFAIGESRPSPIVGRESQRPCSTIRSCALKKCGQRPALRTPSFR